VFDILHRGTSPISPEASSLGATLLVAVNSDASAKRLGKGEERPLNPLADRMAVVAALESVHLVTWFDEDTPLALILASRPEVLAKGGDWKPEAIVGAAEVRGWGGKRAFDPLQARALHDCAAQENPRTLAAAFFLRRTVLQLAAGKVLAQVVQS